MKTREKFNSLLMITTMFALTFILVGVAQAQPENLGENASDIYGYAMAGEEEELQEFLAGLSEEETGAAVRELATELSDKEVREVFPVLFKRMTFNQPVNGMDMFAVAVEASEGRQSVVKGAVQGMLTGAIEHPEVETEDERISAMTRTAEAAAATAVNMAEESDDMNSAQVAFAVMQGGMASIENTDEGVSRARAISEAMSEAGVGAAREPNKPGVARAMMLALVETQDAEVRRAGVEGAGAGGEASGGEPAARAMAPLQRRMAGVEMTAPTPVAPEIDDIPDLDVDPQEVSPF